jgi:hypothetical protein
MKTTKNQRRKPQYLTQKGELNRKKKVFIGTKTEAKEKRKQTKPGQKEKGE